jgi:hypothetical protein
MNWMYSALPFGYAPRQLACVPCLVSWKTFFKSVTYVVRICRRGETKSLNCDHQRMGSMGSRDEIILTGETEELGGKPILNSVTLFTTNPTWIDPGENPVLRRERPATNRLSYGTAKLQCNSFCCFENTLAIVKLSGHLVHVRWVLIAGEQATERMALCRCGILLHSKQPSVVLHSPRQLARAYTLNNKTL